MTPAIFHAPCRHLLAAALCTLMVLTASAYEKHDFLQQRTSRDGLASLLVAGQKWVPFPAYTDRAAWDSITGPLRDSLIGRGEQLLSYRWQIAPASTYLAYKRTGERYNMEDPIYDNLYALQDLLLAELAEGRGRFTGQIIDGVWQFCEMTSWALSAHLPAQRSRSSLPDYDEQIIDLGACDITEALAWVYYFLHGEFDKVTPQISARVRHELRRRILTPYMEHAYWWTGLNAKPGSVLLNNWNPWCNHNVLLAYLMVEDDPQKLADGVWRTLRSVDEYLNYITLDGACDEGPSYWRHSALRLYEYLELMRLATGGRLNYFDLPFVRAQGEYIARCYVGNGWTVNFADAGAHSYIVAPMVWAYGNAVQSPLMKEFAAYLSSGYGRRRPRLRYRQVAGQKLRATAQLTSLAVRKGLEATRPALVHPATTWYAQTQFCFMTSPQGLFLACKGGHNNESHNHNDVGEFALYVDTLPVFIDAGVGTYTQKTFSADRYKIWTMQSDYHNLPRPNGVSQHEGRNYQAAGTTFDARRRLFSTDIAGAYPQEAHVGKWVRSYQLKGKELLLTDRFELTEALAPNEWNFMTWGDVNTDRAGLVQVSVGGRRVSLRYDAARLSVRKERIALSDPPLVNTWGKEIYRLTFTAKQKEQQGTYRFSITKF